MVSNQCWRAPTGATRCLAAITLTALAVTLSACSSTIFSEMPAAIGGLPAGTPERPSAPQGYPAVHDMPPPRDDVVLTDAEQKKIQADLLAARDRQTKRPGTTAKDDQ
jgi:hypothetical protein